jgi:hypothetical protein
MNIEVADTWLANFVDVSMHTWIVDIATKLLRRKKILAFVEIAMDKCGNINEQPSKIWSYVLVLYVQTSKPSIPLDLQAIIDKHSKIFEDIPKGLPPTRNHDHDIHLIPGIFPPNIMPYRYPYAQKSEIECMVEEMLEVGIIRPSQSSYSAPVVMVFKKDG